MRVHGRIVRGLTSLDRGRWFPPAPSTTSRRSQRLQSVAAGLHALFQVKTVRSSLAAELREPSALFLCVVIVLLRES